MQDIWSLDVAWWVKRKTRRVRPIGIMFLVCQFSPNLLKMFKGHLAFEQNSFGLYQREATSGSRSPSSTMFWSALSWLKIETSLTWTFTDESSSLKKKPYWSATIAIPLYQSQWSHDWQTFNCHYDCFYLMQQDALSIVKCYINTAFFPNGPFMPSAFAFIMELWVQTIKLPKCLFVLSLKCRMRSACKAVYFFSKTIENEKPAFVCSVYYRAYITF